MKTILFSGANGFVGRNVIPKLEEKGYQIWKIGRKEGDFIANLSTDQIKFDKKFDAVFHAAGMAHVTSVSSAEIAEFFKQNLQGTINLCKSLEKDPPDFFFFVSSVAVYGQEFGENISEDHYLNPKTPYGKSKLQTEEFLVKWCKSNNVILYLLRPSLILGPNPPGNLKDMINSIKSKKYFNIAGGHARKSVFWVEDFAEIIDLGFQNNGGIYNLCDDRHPSFSEISKKIGSELGKTRIRSIPLFLAKIIASIGDFLGNKFPLNSLKLKKIILPLTFSNDKIKRLGFTPSDSLKNLKL